MMELLRRLAAWAESNPRRSRHDYESSSWSVACLTFYVKQEKAIQDALRRLTGHARARSRFSMPSLELVTGTVDRFQGREADVVLLSMRNVRRVGFLDSPNRLNVAVTRARRQLAVFGNYEYFARRCDVAELEALAGTSRRVRGVNALGGAR